MLKIYNTLNKKKEKFLPAKDKSVNMYVCGVTPYDVCHIGHGRTFIFFDIVYRYLKHLGYQVNYVRNITDIDDKIIKKASLNEENTKNLADRMIYMMQKDFDQLNIQVPSQQPRVTNNIGKIIQVILKLESLGHTYIEKNGDIIFNSATHLKKKLLKENFANLSIKAPTERMHSTDFVLWKSFKKNHCYSERYWESPWGLGRPGWHVECVAMQQSEQCFDIHGGGNDLIFPHHQNELILSECLERHQRVKYWMHTGMVINNNEKLSKAKHSTFSLQKMKSQYNSNTLRFALMSTHYRKPFILCHNVFKKAEIGFRKLYRAIFQTTPFNNNHIDIHKYFSNDFYNAMNDDFNIPKAYAVLFNIAKKIIFFKNSDKILAASLSIQLKKFGEILGLSFCSKNMQDLKIQNTTVKIKEIDDLVLARKEARMQHKWHEADKIRNKLTVMNVVLQDESQGETLWHFKDK